MQPLFWISAFRQPPALPRRHKFKANKVLGPTCQAYFSHLFAEMLRIFRSEPVAKIVLSGVPKRSMAPSGAM